MEELPAKGDGQAGAKSAITTVEFCNLETSNRTVRFMMRERGLSVGVHCTFGLINKAVRV